MKRRRHSCTERSGTAGDLLHRCRFDIHHLHEDKPHVFDVPRCPLFYASAWKWSAHRLLCLALTRTFTPERWRSLCHLNCGTVPEFVGFFWMSGIAPSGRLQVTLCTLCSFHCLCCVVQGSRRFKLWMVMPFMSLKYPLWPPEEELRSTSASFATFSLFLCCVELKLTSHTVSLMFHRRSSSSRVCTDAAESPSSNMNVNSISQLSVHVIGDLFFPFPWNQWSTISSLSTAVKSMWKNVQFFHHGRKEGRKTPSCKLLPRLTINDTINMD